MILAMLWGHKTVETVLISFFSLVGKCWLLSHQPRVDELRDLHLNGNSVMNVFETSYSELRLIYYVFWQLLFFFVEKFCSLRFFCTFAQSLCWRCFIAKSKKHLYKWCFVGMPSLEKAFITRLFSDIYKAQKFSNLVKGYSNERFPWVWLSGGL